jgi:hypothetical protein
MPFYNRPLVQPVGPYINPGGVAIPLKVIEYGGLLRATGSAASGASVGLLAAPSSGAAWRLHRWGVKPVNPTSTGGIQLSDAAGLVDSDVIRTSGGISAYQQDLYGQLSETAVTVTNFGTETLTFWLTYDQVTQPIVM